MFTRSGTTWSQQAYVKASNTGARDFFGNSVALIGRRLDAGGRRLGSRASAATGIDGNQADDSAFVAGAVYVFTRSGAAWSQQAYVKASNTGAGDHFGYSVALSADGSTLAVGADYGDHGVGAAYVLTRSGAVWSQQASVEASSAGTGLYFGNSVSLSGDGATLAVGSYFEPSAATGIDGDETSAVATGAGAVFTFKRSGTAWIRQSYVKASNTSTYAEFGWSVALSSDGATLAVGAYKEPSTATGIDGDQASHSAPDAGAVYVFPWPS